MRNIERDDILNDILTTLQTAGQDSAFFINDTTYSYDQLGEYVANIYCNISNITESNIGVVAEDCIETYASIIAILFSGKTYVILHPSHPEDRNMNIARSAGIKHTICRKNNPLYDILLNNNITTILSDKKPDSTHSIRDIKIKGEKEENAYIIFTSGSTGEPKGVPISRNNLNAFYKAYTNIGWELSKNDRMLQMFELTFDVSVVSTLYPLAIGASIYTVGSDEIKYLKIFELLEEHKLTFAAVAPSVLQLFSPYFDQISLPSLRYLVVTAEASHVDLLNKFKSVAPNAQIYNLYGPTEATIYCTYYHIKDTNNCKQHNGMVAIGRPFEDTEVLITNEQGNMLPDGEMGEMWVSGPQVMSGYLNNAQQTAAAFTTNNDSKKYYKTGDLCVRDKDGDIIYCGRKDYQVKIQGFRIELSEIEYTAKQFLSNKFNVVVIPILSEGVCSELHMAIECADCNENSLLKYLSEKLPYYMIPKKIHCIEQFPTSSSNKIDRKQILTLIQN